MKNKKTKSTTLPAATTQIYYVIDIGPTAYFLSIVHPLTEPPKNFSADLNIAILPKYSTGLLIQLQI